MYIAWRWFDWTETLHNKKNIFQYRIIHKDCCVDGIYSNLNYTRDRILNAHMKIIIIIIIIIIMVLNTL
jgi:hypothetical protein